MKALYLKDCIIELVNIPKPARSGDEALIRVDLAGICETDIELRKGYRSFVGISGHEFVGTVVGAEDSALLNKRVVADINISCGECPVCKAGRPKHCRNRQVIGISGRSGVFAEYVTIPQSNLLVVPDDVPDERAVFTEPLAAALRIFQQVDISKDARIAVVGDGKLGLLVALVLCNRGNVPTVYGRHDNKLAKAACAGAVVSHASITPPEPFDIVIEATGTPEGFVFARRIVRDEGTIVLKSTYVGKYDLSLTELVVNEVRLIGSRCGPMDEALALLSTKAIDVESLISARFPLSEGPAAFDYAAAPGVLKVLLTMG
ncbi:MAG: alcohol dehydrogenase catalytic domain-containing protein [Planctomycetota bacterium]